MLKIALCDDIPAHSERLLSLLESELDAPFEAAFFDSSSALLASLEAHKSFDIFFLDIELGDESGVELARRINGLLPASQIIFVTANLINAVQSGEANHVYFLVKPVEADKLRRALARALEALHAQTDKRIAIPLKNGGDAYVSAGQIVYCERNLRTSTIVCADTEFLSPMSLAALEEALPQLAFARPHTSFLVNLMHVVRTDWQHVYMDNGAVLSLTNHNRAGFRDALAAYVAR